MREARAGEPTEPGLYEGVPDDTYHSWQHLVSQSTLKTVRKLTPHDAYQDLLTPRESTPAQDAGTALHLALLQPDEFEARVACGLGKDRRSKANRLEHEAHEQKHAGKIILKQPDFDKCFAAAEMIKKHPLAMSLIEMEGVMREVAGVFRDDEADILGKFKLDLLGRWQKQHNIIADVKTTAFDMSDDEIERNIGKYGYDIQAAYYLDGVNAIAPAVRRFFFIFVNPTRLTVRVIEPTPSALEHGRIKYRGALNKWAECCRKNEFPGWPGRVTSLGLKPWDEVKDWELDQQLKEAEKG